MSLSLNDGAEHPPLIIRELTGRKRQITLRDRALPHRLGPAWAISQRTVSTRYPGNPEATVQLFGAALDVPTQFSGVWRDRYLMDGDVPVVLVDSPSGIAAPTTAEELVRLFMDIVRAGSELEVTWSFLSRFGVLTKFTPKPDRPEDIAWELEFEWTREGDAAAARAVDVPTLDVTRISKHMAKLSDKAAFDPIDYLVSAQAKLFQQISDLEDKVTGLLEQARVVVGLLSVPAQVVQSVRASATSIAFLAGQIIEEFVGTAYTTTQAVDDLSSVLTGEAWRREMAFFAGELRGSVLDAARALEHKSAPDPVRVVRADQSGSLRLIAAREYGSADAWVDLANANGFDDAFVPPGTEVFVPPRARQEGA